MKLKKLQIPVGVFFMALFFSCAAGGKIWYSGHSRANSYEIEILVNGISRPVYQHYGHSYIQGQIGERYVIRVHNRSWRRVEAIISASSGLLCNRIKSTEASDRSRSSNRVILLRYIAFFSSKLSSKS